MLKEEKEFEEYLRTETSLGRNDSLAQFRGVMKRSRVLIRAVREDVWKEVEPFIGLEPRHDGKPPEFYRNCPKCAAVLKLKEKYAAIRKGRKA